MYPYVCICCHGYRFGHTSVVVPSGAEGVDRLLVFGGFGPTPSSHGRLSDLVEITLTGIPHSHHTTHSLHTHYTPTTHSLHPHYILTTHSLHPHYTPTTHSLHTHYTPTTHSLHPHYTPTTSSLHTQYTTLLGTVCQKGTINEYHINYDNYIYYYPGYLF